MSLIIGISDLVIAPDRSCPSDTSRSCRTPPRSVPSVSVPKHLLENRPDGDDAHKSAGMDDGSVDQLLGGGWCLLQPLIIAFRS